VKLLNAVLGNASEVPAAELQTEFARLLMKDECILCGYRLVRDVFMFTGRRLLLVDKQGLTGKKLEYLSIPYKSITKFSIETAGTFDLDAELKIWVAGSPDPVSQKFSKGVDVYKVQTLLAKAVCGA
jgi:Bacterial PH domain